MDLYLFLFRKKFDGIGRAHPGTEFTPDASPFVVPDTPPKILGNRYRRIQGNVPPPRSFQGPGQAVRQMGSEKGIGSVFLSSLTQHLYHHSIEHDLPPFYRKMSREIRSIPATARLETLSQ